MTGPAVTEPAVTGRSARPVLRIVGGHATAEELAALVAVLASRPAATAEEPARHPGWPARADLLRRPHPPGPGAWRASVRPR